jgi:hypothetical protein
MNKFKFIGVICAVGLCAVGMIGLVVAVFPKGAAVDNSSDAHQSLP